MSVSNIDNIVALFDFNKLKKSLMKSVKSNLAFSSRDLFILNFMLKKDNSMINEFFEVYRKNATPDSIAAFQEAINALKCQDSNFSESHNGNIRSFIVGVPIYFSSYHGNHKVNLNALKSVFKHSFTNNINTVFSKLESEIKLKNKNVKSLTSECLNGCLSFYQVKKIFESSYNFDSEISSATPFSDVTFVSDKINAMIVPVKVSIVVEATQNHFDYGDLFNEIFNDQSLGQQIRTEALNTLSMYFNHRFFNVDCYAPMLINELVESKSLYTNFEMMRFDISKQSIIASPSDYFVRLQHDKEKNFLRIQFYVGNDVYYTFDYGSLVSFDHLNNSRDIDVIKYNLERIGFRCSVCSMSADLSLENAHFETKFKLVM